LIFKENHTHAAMQPQMQCGSAFGCICLIVCFQSLNVEALFLVCRCIFTHNI